MQVLIEAGANMLIRDAEQFPTMMRVAVFADSEREFARACFREFGRQSKAETRRRLTYLATNLQELPDVKIRFTFQFHSWVPFVGRFLPSDTCTITKVGLGCVDEQDEGLAS